MRIGTQRRSEHNDEDVLLARRLSRGWRHERGAEAVEALTLVAIMLMALAVLSLAFRDHAAALGDAALAMLVDWLAALPGALSPGVIDLGAAPQTTTLPLTGDRSARHTWQCALVNCRADCE